MIRRPAFKPCLAAGTALALVLAAPVMAHDTAEADGQMHDNIHLHGGGNDGHVPSNVNYGFALVGWDSLGGVETGRYTDVWVHKDHAYVGTFQEPTCTRAGVYIADVSDPANPTTIEMIKSPPDTRINDVKVHEIGGKDVLSMTLEPCGPITGQGRATGNDTGSQRGKGGISLYDVSNPAKPKALKQNFLDTPVHNTFFWTTGTGTYLMAVDDVNLNDVIIMDVSKPQAPKVLTVTGIGDWLVTNPEIEADGQLFTGSFAAPLLHDIWVEQMPDGTWQAVLSYWDAGFIILDVTDPAAPVFLGDSTYPDPDPVLGKSPAEGNAHAAVFGGTSPGGSDLIFGGDEDFDALETLIFDPSGATYAATQGDNVPQIGVGAAVPSVSGPSYYVGLACGSATPAPDPAAIAVIQRGTCSFTEKAQTAEAAGYKTAIVFNHATGCEASVSMIVSAGIPALFVPRSSGFSILGIAGYDPTTCDGSGADQGDGLLVLDAPGQVLDIKSSFDGWGYLHIINNSGGDMTVPYKGEADRTIGQLGEVGYYAPVEATDPALAVGFGDLTMHNIEADPSDRRRSFISWYSAGMRAVEWRPGHLHSNQMGEGTVSWNVHEVGRWIASPSDYPAAAVAEYGDTALTGSNFWGVTVGQVGGKQYVFASDRNTGLHIFEWTCIDRPSPGAPLYCNP